MSTHPVEMAPMVNKMGALTRGASRVMRYWVSNEPIPPFGREVALDDRADVCLQNKCHQRSAQAEYARLSLLASGRGHSEYIFQQDKPSPAS